MECIGWFFSEYQSENSNAKNINCNGNPISSSFFH